MGLQQRAVSHKVHNAARLWSGDMYRPNRRGSFDDQPQDGFAIDP